ncbi:MAG TPA: flagellar basal body rod protein FlgC [Firmicutes bacterium]|nr:flagellar basal body rod protein FlgC [Bacillota bacterium]
MPSFSAMDISGSALYAGRVHMEVIASNIANAGSTRSERGGPYRRLITLLAAKENRVPPEYRARPREGVFDGRGVQVLGVVEDQSPLPLKFDPDHPDAGPDGFVAMPNVDPLSEMADLIIAARSYEANITVFNATKQMAMKALEIGKA